MARRGQRERGKEHFWRRLLRQWRGSGLTIRAFCAEHEVSEPSFFAWRRTIAQRDQRTRRRARPGQDQGADGHPVFVPLRVLPAPAGATTFEVVLRHGRVVRVPASFDPAALRQLFVILEEEPSC